MFYFILFLLSYIMNKAILLLTTTTTWIILPIISYAISFETVLTWMHDKWLTKYNQTQEFRPSDKITRWETAKFVSKYAEVIGLSKTYSICDFNDISEYDSTLVPHITESCKYGLLKWSNGSFKPLNTITEAEAMTLIVRSYEWMQDETVIPWYLNYFTKAKWLGLLDDNDTLESVWKTAITRERLWTWFYALWWKLEQGIIRSKIWQKQTAINDVDFHERILETYNFNPCDYKDQTQIEILNRSSRLDNFRKFVESDKEKYIPMLRNELENKENIKIWNGFFYFDWSVLLERNVSSKADLQFIADNFWKVESVYCWLDDTEVFLTFHKLATQNIDIWSWLMIILNKNDFFVFLPKHALSFKKEDAIWYILFAWDDKEYIDHLISLYRWETDSYRKAVFLQALRWAWNEKTYKIVEELLVSTKESDKRAQEELKKLLVMMNTWDKSLLSDKEIEDLKTQRKNLAKWVSDEALYEILDITIKINNTYRKDLKY